MHEFLLSNLQVPVMIQRLCELQAQCPQTEPALNCPPDAQHASQKTDRERKESDAECRSRPSTPLGSAQSNGSGGDGGAGTGSSQKLPDSVDQSRCDPQDPQDPQGGRAAEHRKRNRQNAKQIVASCGRTPEGEDREQLTSSTSWAAISSMLIGSDYSLSPLSAAMEQRLILQYLTPLGDYHEVTGHVVTEHWPLIGRWNSESADPRPI